MTESSLNITFVGDSPPGSEKPLKWANITGEIPQPEVDKKCSDNADLYDIDQMLTAARSGVSARNYVASNCESVEINGEDVTVTIPFYVWPSSLDLNYSLTANHGTISAGKVIRSPIDQLLAITMQRSVDLGYIFEGELAQKSQPYNRYGTKLIDIDATIYNGQIVVQQEAFIGYRITGNAIGYEHELKMTITKEDGYKIENLNNNIVLSWNDEEGDNKSKTLAVGSATGGADSNADIPDCVNTMLETCSDGTLLQDVFRLNPDDGTPVRVYYSACDGEIIRIDD